MAYNNLSHWSWARFPAHLNDDLSPLAIGSMVWNRGTGFKGGGTVSCYGGTRLDQTCMSPFARHLTDYVAASVDHYETGLQFRRAQTTAHDWRYQQHSDAFREKDEKNAMCYPGDMGTRDARLLLRLTLTRHPSPRTIVLKLEHYFPCILR